MLKSAQKLLGNKVLLLPLQVKTRIAFHNWEALWN